MRPHQLLGQRFERLTVVEQMPSQHSRTMWKCVCACGAEIISPPYPLMTGHTKSCGCYKLSLMRVASLRHGMTGTKTHNIWQGILKRCQNPAAEAYPDYGGRGIIVCTRWQVFENFLSDMGECPSDDHSIERVDVNGNYEPGNCVWLPRQEQGLNMRRSRMVTIDGETKSLARWCKDHGLRYGLVYDRITRLGWPPKRALTERGHA